MEQVMGQLLTKAPVKKAYRFLTAIHLLIVLNISPLFAEGTKQLQPAATDFGFLQIYDQNTLTRPFATYNSPEEYRLNISICNLGEKIYMGFRQNNNDVYFRLKDPNGNVVLGPQLIPASGQGFINSHADAISGPLQATGNGYYALEYTPTMTGDYYIEFNPSSPTAVTPQKRVFNFIDLTVADTLGGTKIIKPGRLYSKNWDFQCMSDKNPFLAELFVYAKDSIVTALNFNGMNGYGFTVAANSKGCTNTGDAIADRQSRYGNHTFPEYKIFLNNPDPECYPSGTFGQITEPSTITGCEDNNRCINVYVNKPGEVEVTLELNGIEGYQEGSSDVLFQVRVEQGHNCIPWNTRDGLGNIVPPGTEMFIVVNYFNGLTHLPLFDVEHNRNGYIVNLIRPIPPSGMTKPKLYWDDSRLNPTIGTALDGMTELLGCELEGCHRWENRGVNGPNMETINTWWYANVIKDDISYVVETVTTDANAHTPLGARNDTTVCVTSLPYILFGEITGAPGGIWSGGEGSFSDDDDLFATYTPSSNEISIGKASIALTSAGNSACPSVTDSMNIYIIPKPLALPSGPASVCFNNPSVSLSASFQNATGGTWTGGEGSFFPSNTSLNAIYEPSYNELFTSSLQFTFTTAGNAYCEPESAGLEVLILPPPSVNAGPDLTICANNAPVNLNGTVEGASGGIWTGGNGSFDPDANTLNATYIPSAEEISQGWLELILSSTGNGSCLPVSDTLKITIAPTPTVNAGPDQTICLNNTVSLNALLSGAPNGIWSGGSGSFSPSANTTNPTYTPSTSENIVGRSFTLTFTAADTLNCNPVSDDLVVNITSGPEANAGPDIFACNNSPSIQLNGSVTQANGGRWLGGNGTFQPGRNALNTVYTPTPQEAASAVISLRLRTRSSGTCSPDRDTVLIIMTSAPTVNAGSDLSLCSNNPSVSLNGTVSNASGRNWSGGNGTFSPNTSSLNAVYTPTTAEIESGALTLTLSGNRATCLDVIDQVHISFLPSPEVDAGPDKLACKNNPEVTVTGTVSTATGGLWTGGSGQYNPSSSSPTIIYTASDSEIDAGFAELTLTSTGNGNCLPVQDVVRISFTPTPVAEAGEDIQICYNNPTVNLNGTVAGATGGLWTNGEGSFSPNNTDLQATYIPSQTELDAGAFFLVLTTSGNGNCNPVTDTVRISVLPAPLVNAGPDITVCTDAPQADLIATVSGAGGVSWSGGNGTWNSANTLSATYTPTQEEITTGSVLLSVTTTANGLCNAVSDQILITITPAPYVDAGPDQMICGTESSFVLDNPIFTNAGGIQWSSNGTGTFSPSSASLTPTYTVSEADRSGSSLIITVTTTDNGKCNPVSDDLQIFFTPEPIANAGSDRTVCSNSFPVKLNASGTKGSWSGGAGSWNPGPNVRNPEYFPSPSEITAGTVTLTYTTNQINACPAVSDEIVLSLIDGPDVNAGPDMIICGNSTNFQLSTTLSNSSGVFWNSSGTGTLSSNTSLSPKYNPSDADKTNNSIIFNVRTTGNGICRRDVDTVLVSFSPEVSVNAGPDQTICADVNTIQLNGTVANATSVIWTSSGSGSFSSSTALAPIYSPSEQDLNSGSLTFTLSTEPSGPCPAFSDQIIYSFSPAPIISAGPDKTICAEKDTIHLSGTVTVATDYKWTTTGSGSFSPSASSDKVVYTLSEDDKTNGSFRILFSSLVQGSCNPVSDDLLVTILPEPAVNAGKDTSVCETTQSVQLSGSVTSAGGGIWSAMGSGIFSDNTGTSTVYTFSAQDKSSGIITFTLSSTDNGLCSAASDKMHLSFVKPPQVDAGPNRTVCESETEIAITGSFSGANGIAWATSGTGTFSPASTNTHINYMPSLNDVQNETVVLTLLTTGNSVCNPAIDSLELTFQKLPAINAGPDEIICGDSSYVLLQGVLPAGENGNWSSSGTGTFAPDKYADTVRYYPSSQDIAIGQLNFTYVSEPGICEEVTDSKTVLITPIPTVNAGQDRTVCSLTSSIQLSGSIAIADEGRWETSGSGFFSPDANSKNANYIPSSSDTAAGSVLLTIYTTGNGSCKEKKDQINIHFAPAPLANAGLDMAVCSNENTISLTGIIRNATGGIWSSTGTGSLSPSASSLGTEYIVSSSDTANGIIRFILTSSGNGLCPAAKDTLLVTLDPVPTVSSQDVRICFDETGAQLNASRTNATGFVWTSTGTGSFSPDNSAESPVYIPSLDDKAAGEVNITVMSSGTGQCSPAIASSKVSITPPPTVYAGPDITICEDSEGTVMAGNVINAEGGIWTSSGTGFFFPDNQSLNATYLLSEDDAKTGTVELTLISTGNGNCFPATDKLVLTIEPRPELNAGPDISVCEDATQIDLQAFIQNADGAFWQVLSGTGTFSPTAESASTSFMPSSQDLIAGSVTLLATATGTGSCNTPSDDITISFTGIPQINAGEDKSICISDLPIILKGFGSSAEWVGGAGSFSPGRKALTASYTPHPAEIINGSVTLTLSTINNGSCLAQTDDVTFTFLPGPSIDAGPDQTICADMNSISLNATFSNAVNVIWSSSGSGSFTNPLAATTQYFPSELDKKAGSFSLIATTDQTGLCRQQNDKMLVTVISAPVVNAGQNQLGCIDKTVYNLNASSKYASGIIWNTSGTGTFSNPSDPNSTYTASSDDFTAGKVTLTVTSLNDALCTTVNDQTLLTFVNPPFVDAGLTQEICADREYIQLIGSVTGATGGIWTSTGTGQFYPGTHSLTARYYLSEADKTAGSVSLTLTSTGNGSCNSRTANTNIVINKKPLVSFSGIPPLICADETDIPLQALVENAGSVSWSSTGSGTFSPTNSGLSASYIPAKEDIEKGAIQIQVVTTANLPGCNPETSTKAIAITPAPAVVINSNTDIKLCESVTEVQVRIKLSASNFVRWTSNGDGSFFPDNLANSPTYIPGPTDRSTGSVTLHVETTDNGRCQSASDEVVVEFLPVPLVSTDPVDSICSGSSIPLSGIVENATRGMWTSSGTGSFSPSANLLNTVYIPSPADIKRGQVEFAFSSAGNNYCPHVSTEKSIVLIKAPTASAGPDQVVCDDTEEIKLKAEVSNTEAINWTSSGTGSFSNPTALTPVYYPSVADATFGNIILKVSASGADICTQTEDAVQINFMPYLNISAGPDIEICADMGAIPLKASAGNSSLLTWSSQGSGEFKPSRFNTAPQYIPSPADTSAGNIVLTLSAGDDHVCGMVLDTLVIRVSPRPIADIAAINTCYFEEGIALQASFQNAAGGSWATNGTGLFSPSPFHTSATYYPGVEDAEKGSVKISFFTTGNGICPADSLSSELSLTPPPPANAGPDKRICRNGETLLSANAGNGLTYQWISETGSAIRNSKNITISANSNTWYALTVRDAKGCESFDTVTVMVVDPPSLDLKNHHCLNDSLWLDSKPMPSSPLPGIFQWYRDDMVLPYEMTSVLFVTAAGDHVVLYNDGSCSVLDSSHVTAPPALFTANVFDCEGNSVTVTTTAINNATYSWFNNGTQVPGSSNSIDLSVLADTTVYFVRTEDPHGCVGQDSVIIVGLPDPVFNLKDSTVCVGKNIIFNAVPLNIQNPHLYDPEYKWRHQGNIISTADSLVITGTGKYILQSRFGKCFSSDTADITMLPLPSPDLKGPEDFCSETDKTVNLDAGTWKSYYWQHSSDTGRYVDIYEEGLYSVLVTNEYNCSAKDSIYIFDICPPRLFPPSAISPNGDGHNERFAIFGNYFTNYEIMIFNRWGEIIFHSTNPEEGWDGTYRGELMPVGVYAWIITYNGKDEKYKGPYKLEGKVTLIR